MNKTEKPFSLQDDEKIDMRDKDYNTVSVTNSIKKAIMKVISRV